eukprot:1679833-Pyramimonas_sp.AAC.1
MKGDLGRSQSHAGLVPARGTHRTGQALAHRCNGLGPTLIGTAQPCSTYGLLRGRRLGGDSRRHVAVAHGVRQ